MAKFFDNLRDAVNRNIKENSAKASNKETVLKNTFQRNTDGTNYGVGTDGRTYSYTVGFSGKTSDPILLSAEEQRDAINKLTDGKITINPIIKNQKSLTDIHRSINRMYEKGGALTPEEVEVYDMSPGQFIAIGAPMGTTYERGSNSYNIAINGIEYPEYRRDSEKKDAEDKFSTSNKAPGEYVPTHELSHAAQFSTEKILSSWMENKEKEAESKNNKYSVPELLKQFVMKNFAGKEYEPRSVGDEMLDLARQKYISWEKEASSNGEKTFLGDNLFDEAAKNTGFKSIDDAAETISGYAGKKYLLSRLYPDKKNNKLVERYEEHVKLPEVFAEAYSDVLFNEDEAAPYSKELVRLYKDYADKWSKKVGRTKSVAAKDFEKMLSTLPKIAENSTQQNYFIQNYRSAPWRYK